MGITRFVFLCTLSCFIVLFDFSYGNTSDQLSTKLRDESRGLHRLQLLFPLLLRISTRLATLVPTALMGLLGIFLFVFFSKKALLVSLLALYLTWSDKNKNKKEEIHIHKINSYLDDYNAEEHFHYYHWPSKYTKYYYKGKNPWKGKWKKGWKRTIQTLPHIEHPIPLNNVEEFKPMPSFNFLRRIDEVPQHLKDHYQSS